MKKSMIETKKIMFGLLIFMLVFAITACQSEDESTNDYTPNEPTTNEVQEEKEEELSDVDETYNTFKNSLQNNPEYIVEYDLTYSNGNKENVVIYTKDDVTRMDFKNDDVIVWMNGEQVVKYEGECIDLSAANNLGFDPESIYQSSTVEGSIKSEDEYLSAKQIGTKSIAGQTVDCYEFIYETNTINQLTTYCLSNTGIPALIETKNRDTDKVITKTEALTIEDSVSNKLLEPCDVTVDISSFI